MLRRSGRDQRGTALIIVMTLLLVFAGLVGSMVALHAIRDQSEFEASERLARMYACESGLERARLEVTQDENWLAGNVGLAAATFANGQGSYVVGGFTVTVRIIDEPGEWCRIESSAAKNGITSTLAMTGKGGTCFADYARFVSKGNLNIGNYASYGGKVHSNAKIGVIGSYITFYDDVTCVGNITYSSQGKKTVTFYKSATTGVNEIPLPTGDKFKDLAESAPKGAILYDWNDPAFKNKFEAATGVPPADALEVKIVLKQSKMDVISTSNGKTMTESNIDVPHDGTVYSPAPVTVSGNMSRRMSILTPEKIYLDGPLRYTDDAGNPQWLLQEKATGKPMPFDAETNSWSMMGNWNGPEYEYVEAADWMNRQPLVDGKKIHPSLGIVSADTIYISGENDNREVHAALFSSGDVVRPKVGGKKNNLWIHGAIITTGTNPVSGYFSYRCYAYDPHLKDNPPPGFPGGDAASFRNYHIIDLERR